MLVGDPKRIPFEFQHELDLRYAVGRLSFERLESYRRYAEAVLEAEARALRNRRMSFFAVEHEEDPVTQACIDQLVSPLAKEVDGRPNWSVESVLGHEANRQGLQDLLSDSSKPSILLTAGHSPVLEAQDPRQKDYHGAIITADWIGPQQDQPVGPEHVFAASDIDSEADLRGLIAIMVGCFSGGTPRFDAFTEDDPRELAPEPFVARLPQALLDRGALAVVAHVDSLYMHSFAWPGSRPRAQHQTYGDMVYRLASGRRLGQAMDTFGRRYAELAAYVLASRLEPDRVDAETYSAYWIGYHDARQYLILGDPAVHLSIPSEGSGCGTGP